MEVINNRDPRVGIGAQKGEEGGVVPGKLQEGGDRGQQGFVWGEEFTTPRNTTLPDEGWE